MGLFDKFRKKHHQPEKSYQPFDGPTILYHEDDFRQVEIVPSDNLPNLQKESEKIDAFGKEHFDGTGFTDMYVRREENNIKLIQRQINPKELKRILGLLELESIPNVLTGYGQSYSDLRKNCIAFRKGNSSIYYDFTDNFVKYIWLSNHWSMDRERLAQVIHQLGQEWDLLLQDWNLRVTVDLKI